MTDNREPDLAREATGEALGAWVREMRQRQRFSQRELAERAGLSRSYVCDIERGRGSHPSMETIDKLAAALGLSRLDLLRASGVVETGAGLRANDDERRLLAVYRDLSEPGRNSVMRYARFIHADEHQWVQERLLDDEAALARAAGEGRLPLFEV